MKKLFFLLLLPGVFECLHAQGDRYRKYEFKWEQASPPAITVADTFRHEDAVMLLDENEINFRSEEVTRHVRIKLLTQKGADKNRTIAVPDSYDPAADYKDANLLAYPDLHRPKLGFDQLVYFAARIIRPDGTVIPAVLSTQTQEEGFYLAGSERKFFSFFFKITNAEVGDEIECSYSYRLPIDFYNRYGSGALNEFMSVATQAKRDLIKQFSQPYSRIFFHGTLPKQKFKLDMVFNTRDLYIFAYPNNGRYSDSTTNVSAHFTKMTWERNNLLPCMAEKGARFYTELPYVHFYLHNKDYGLKKDMNDLNYQKFLPYTWHYALLKDIAYRPVDFKYLIQAKDDRTVAFNNFFHQQTDTLADTSAYAKLRSIHNKLTEDFNYQNDFAVRTGEDFLNERVRKYMEAGKLREMTRYELYYNMLYRIDYNFFKVNLHDKRIEKIDYENFFPQISLNGYFCLVQGEIPVYFSPKHHRFGHYLNELPFYLEDTPNILIPQNLDPEEYYKSHLQVNYMHVTSPQSLETSNIRNSNMLVAIAADSGKASFDGKVELFGQFSTMMRGFYQYGYVDSSVSNKYHMRIFDIPGVSKSQCRMVSHSPDFPFKTGFRISYSSNKLVEKHGSDYVVNLSDWFRHITIDDFSARNRQLTFFPDFTHKDTYRYSIRFDRPVQITNAEELATDISNSFGSYKFVVTQPEPTVILVQSLLVVNAEFVPSGKAMDVEAIYSSIAKMNRSSLKCRAVN